MEFPSFFRSKFLPVLFPNDTALINCTVHYVSIDYTPNTSTFGLVNLFKDRTGSARDYVGSSEIDKIYSSYMELLIRNYESLSVYYLQIVGRCINLEMRTSLEHRCFPSALRLPGNKSSYLDNTFSQRVASHSPEKVGAELINELHLVGAQVSQLWRKMLDLINKNTRQILNLLKEQHYVEMRNIINRGVIRKVLRAKSFASANNKSCETNHTIAEIRRKDNEKQQKSMDLMAQNPHIKESNLIIIEELFLGASEICTPSANFSSIFLQKRKKCSELHLIVLVHGYQGSPQDMQILRNEISQLFPYTAFLISVSNENKTDSSIEELGNNLALELRVFLSEAPASQIGIISFIGHSLGGLIIRAAVPLLTDLQGKFHLFMTLSSPHLGVQEASKLVRAGIWIVSNLNKASSLCELRLSDSKNIEDSLLYRMAGNGATDMFTHFALVSSPQDSYSPYFSSRIEVMKKASKNYKAYMAMAKNLLMNRQKLQRIDADFKIINKNLDSWIGRAGHVEFLENRQFMKFLLYLHPEFFE